MYLKLNPIVFGSQRDIDVERARQIGEDWSDFFVNDPILSFDTKTGIYHEPSGQHTCAGYIWRVQNGLETNTSLWCRVADDLSEKQLNAIFAYEAIMRDPQKTNSVMQALWNCNDPFLHKLSTLVNAYGYTIPCNKNGNPALKCIQTLFDLTDEEIDRTLEFISYVFPYSEVKKIRGKKTKVNSCSIEGTFIKAVNLFIDWYAGKYDLKKLKENFDAKEAYASYLKKSANDLNEFESKPVIRILYMIVRTYNSGIRKNKLSYLNFEDYR